MSGGIEDAAYAEREKAMRLARDKYPGIEVVEYDWRKAPGWPEEQAYYLIRIVRALEKDVAVSACPHCEGTGFEKIIYLYTSGIKHHIVLVYWHCRKCRGGGRIIGKEDET